MRNNLKKFTAILLTLVMIAGSFATMALAVFAADDSADIKKGEFIFAPHTYTEGDLSDIYYYTDSVFAGSALDYNEHLATMSMILAASSISSQDPDVDYDNKSRNLANIFREWDFSGFEVNDYYMQKPEEQTMGVGIAYKIIGEGDDAYTLLAIIPRSAGYEKEWAGNFTVGKEGVHQGFATGRDIILDFATKYVEANSEDFVGEVKVWTVGYSRGAGVSNLLAAYLDDNSGALGVEVAKENIFAYNFGTPSTVEYADEAEKASFEDNYKNIHNRYSEYDIVTYAPFKDWNFTYYGTTKLFDTDNAEAKAEMLTYLEKTNKTIYDLYVAEGSSADPDNFIPLMLQLDLTEGIKTNFIPADSSYGIPTTQAEFLNSRIAFLVENLVPDRETYVDGGYEYALQCMTSLYFGLDSEQSALLAKGMSHDLATLAAAYYCYFISDFYLDTEIGLAAVSLLITLLPVIEKCIELLSTAEGISTSQWYLYASSFIASEEYLQMKGMLEAINADEQTLAGNVGVIKNLIRSFAVGMTSKVLGSGVSALTIDETEKAKLLETMTSEAVAGPLTEFIVYLLLGSEDGISSPFNPSNKNIALAVTFVANAGRYMRVHNNEIILSWLRTEDSYYENEDWHVHEEQIVYDENGHWGECECGYKSEVRLHAFSEWSTTPINNGEKDVVVRRCPCGYEEFKDAPIQNNSDGLGTTAIVLICVGAVVVIGAAVTVIIVAKKRKHNGE